MSKGRTKNATLNIVFSLVLQLVTFVRGLILPRIIIPIYGSDVNGLISSITQFLTYISLLEAGVGSIFRTSLYKPLANNDIESVSGIINEQKRFYRKIGIMFVFYVIALCVVYPMIAKTTVDRPYIISCILILSIGTFAEYFVSLPYAALLSADQKIRISYTVSIAYTIVNIFVALFWACLKADIRMIYLSMCIIGLLKPFFYTFYVKKHYQLNKEAQPNKTALNQRWNGMVHHFAYYIHTNTDSMILTIFIGTAMVSVYNIYGAIIFGVERIITSIATGTAAGLGNLLTTNNKERINHTIDLFELIQGGVATVFYTITALLLIPFVRIYTADMSDVNYIHTHFGYVLIIAEAVYCFRCIYSTISMNANKYKETQLGAVLECITNLAVSLALVLILKMGLLGVAIGTLAGMLIRYVFEICYISKAVVYRPITKAVKMLMVSGVVVVVSILTCNVFMEYAWVKTFGEWFVTAVITSLITGGVAILVYLIFYEEIVKSLIKRVFRRG